MQEEDSMNAAGMRPSAVEDTSYYTYKLAYDASNNLEYMGKSVIGSGTSEAKWQIIKLTYDASNNLTGILWAGGLESFVNIWDNRASLSYS